jgi:hypothetical protein
MASVSTYYSNVLAPVVHALTVFADNGGNLPHAEEVATYEYYLDGLVDEEYSFRILLDEAPTKGKNMPEHVIRAYESAARDIRHLETELRVSGSVNLERLDEFLNLLTAAEGDLARKEIFSGVDPDSIVGGVWKPHINALLLAIFSTIVEKLPEEVLLCIKAGEEIHLLLTRSSGGSEVSAKILIGSGNEVRIANLNHESLLEIFVRSERGQSAIKRRLLCFSE